MNLLRAITTVGGYTMMSRVLGFARDILIAAVLGAGTTADAFFVAFRLPNLFRRLFAEGAFNPAFVPIFAELLEAEGPERARLFANQALSGLALVLAVFVALFEIMMPWAMWGLAPGFDAVPGKMALATELSRITFPYLLFISLVSLQSGVLNALGRFAAAAFAPVLLNLTLIASLFALVPWTPSAGHALGWGVFAAGVIQCAWLFAACRRAGTGLRLLRPRLSPEVKLLARRILPVVFGASLYQINLLIGTILASFVSDGAVSYLYYADRVVQLPLGVVGVAVGTALLPILSRRLSAGETEAANHTLNRGLEFAALLTLPATVALIVIPGPITSVLFERGAFGAAESAATAAAMAAFAAGLPAYVLVRTLSPAFFARQDTVTPVRIAAVAMVLNVVLNLILMQFLAHVGIALGAAISSWVNALALAWVLRRRGLATVDARLARRLPRIALACLALGAGLGLGRWGLGDLLAGGQWARIGALAGLVGGGLALYALAARATGAAHAGEMRRFLRRDAA